MKRRQLLNELRKVGASDKEANDLVQVSYKLARGATNAKLSRKKKRLIAQEIGFGRERTYYQTFIAVGYAMLAALLVVPVVLAQFSLPGDPLYFVKRGTEAVRSVVQPGFADSATQRREKEIEKLKAEGASDSTIQKAEKEVEKASGSGAHGTDSSGSASDDTTHSSTDDNTSSQTQTQTQNQNRNGSTSDDSTKTQAAPSAISLAQARAIADAQLPSNTYDNKYDLKTENGVYTYTLYYDKGSLVKINATTGAVISVKQ